MLQNKPCLQTLENSQIIPGHERVRERRAESVENGWDAKLRPFKPASPFAGYLLESPKGEI